MSLAIEKPTICIAGTQGKEIVVKGKKGGKKEGNRPAVRSVEEEIADGVEAFFRSDFGDTAVKRSENQKRI